MPDTDNRDLSEAVLNSDPSSGEKGEEEAQRLALEVNVDNRSTCERHVTVTIPARTSSGTSTRSSPS